MKILEDSKKRYDKLFGYLVILLVFIVLFSAYFQLYPPARLIGTAKTAVDISLITFPLKEVQIPTIENPKFIPVSAVNFMDSSDLVIGVNYNNVIKAYPIRIMNWHEIVNDYYGNEPVTVTYCALCRTGIVFDGRNLGKPIRFNSTGLLYNSNPIMLDKETNSYWSQMTGGAIIGDTVGDKLNKIPSDIVPWGLWKQKYPSSLVLSNDTGFNRDYSFDPYGGYQDTAAVWYNLTNVDKRLFSKDIVYGVNFDSYSKAYPKTNVTSIGVINDIIGSHSVLVVYDSELDSVRVFNRIVRGNELNFQIADGKLMDKETKSVWNMEGVSVSGPLITESLKRIDTTYGFWAIWAAFYPKTKLFLLT